MMLKKILWIVYNQLSDASLVLTCQFGCVLELPFLQKVARLPTLIDHSLLQERRDHITPVKKYSNNTIIYQIYQANEITVAWLGI